MCLARARLAEVDKVLLAARAEISSSLVALIQNQLSHSDAPLADILFFQEKEIAVHGGLGAVPNREEKPTYQSKHTSAAKKRMHM